MVSRIGQEDELRLTDWDFRPRRVHLEAGAEISGYRLRPGVTIGLQCSEMHASAGNQLETMIEDTATGNDEVGEIISVLSAPHATVAGIAKQVGVTIRTLQRRFESQQLPPPDHWRLLGRARRAAQALHCRVSLAEIACQLEYSDQAHMTREIVRWFGFTPTQLRRDKYLLDEISQPGLGSWPSAPIKS